MSVETPIVCSFQLTKRDLWRATNAATRRTLAYKLGWLFFGGCPAAVLLLAFAIQDDPLEFVVEHLAGLFGGPLLMLVGFPLLRFWSVASVHKNNANIGRPQTFEFAPTYLEMRGPLHTTRLDWRAVNKVVETRDDFLFYISRHVMHFFPKAALRQSDVVALRRDLAAWLPGRTELRGPAAPAPAA